MVEASEVQTDEEAQAEFAEALDDLCFAILRATGRGVPGGDTELTLSQYNVPQALGDGPATVSEIAAPPTSPCRRPRAPFEDSSAAASSSAAAIRARTGVSSRSR